jgi:hypothetical protein
MTVLARNSIEITNPARRDFLAQLRALGGLVLVAGVPGVLKAADVPSFG